MHWLLLHGLEDVGVTGLRDAKDRDSVVFTAGGAELDVVSVEVVHGGSGKHGVVLDLGLSQRRAVVGDDDQLALASAQLLQGLLESCLRLEISSHAGHSQRRSVR